MTHFDPGSFKDPAGRVFSHDGTVCRTLSPAALEHIGSAYRCGLIRALVADGLLIETELEPSARLGLSAAEVGELVLTQPRVPVVTYSYEWSFEMLRDAALLTLRAIERALESGFILKDATAFNVLFRGTQPVLVDVLSLEPHEEGTIWAGYSQFCRSFLFPLLLASYRDIEIRPLLLGHLGELPVREVAKLFRIRDYPRAGVLKDVIVQAALDRSFGARQAGVKASTAGRHVPRSMILANVRRLRALIERLAAPAGPSEWSDYDQRHTYAPADREAKAAFVTQAVAQHRGGRVVDLGCNTGEYAALALAAGASSVIAVDLDARAIDRLYRSHPGHTSLTPIVATLLHPTPAMGWGLRERASLIDRLQADGFLALALIHHLRITGGVPLESIVSQLLRIAPTGVIEWVDKQDAMVMQMLSLRRDVYDDYTWETFQTIVSRVADIVAVHETHGGRRRLCRVRARQVAAAPAACGAPATVTA